MVCYPTCHHPKKLPQVAVDREGLSEKLHLPERSQTRRHPHPGGLLLHFLALQATQAGWHPGFLNG